jgi:hypothetical protein
MGCDMKGMIIFICLFLLSGCFSTTGMYRTSSGEQFETTEEMAYLMSSRDIAQTKARGFYDAVAKSTRPEQVVAATAAFFGDPGPKLERKRSWDERLLPWVQVLSPYFSGYLGGARSGESTAQIDGDGNTVYISRDEISGGSQKGAYIYPTTSISYQTQTGTDASANGDGSYYPTYDSSHDNPITYAAP